jgi:2-oxoglutarate ferredoxin oxidoreductase subunit alpha
VPAPIVQRRPDASVGVITVGGCDPAVREALDLLAEQGRPMDYMRIRAFPFHADVDAFLAEHDYCYVVEQNRDGQLRSLLILETQVAKDRLRPVLIYSGFPLSAKHVVDAMESEPSVTEKKEEFDAVYR